MVSVCVSRKRHARVRGEAWWAPACPPMSLVCQSRSAFRIMRPVPIADFNNHPDNTAGGIPNVHGVFCSYPVPNLALSVRVIAVRISVNYPHISTWGSSITKSSNHLNTKNTSLRSPSNLSHITLTHTHYVYSLIFRQPLTRSATTHRSKRATTISYRPLWVSARL